MVEAAIAHVSEMELGTYDGKRGTSGSHPAKIRMLRRVTLNRMVGRFQGIKQCGLRIGAKGMFVDLAYGLHSEATGLLSAFVSTHAVRDDGQAAFAAEFFVRFWLPVEIRIFIIDALAADIGEARGFDPGLWSLAVDCHK